MENKRTTNVRLISAKIRTEKRVGLQGDAMTIAIVTDNEKINDDLGY